MQSPILDFYYFDSCPYCKKVMRVIDELKIKVNYMHIYENTVYMEKLLYITGRKTVPCLFIDGVPMHESSDIVDWLKANEKNLLKID